MVRQTSTIAKKPPKFYEERSESISFRINKQVLDKLRNHASSQDITLNAFVNQILFQAVEWNILAARAGWVPIPKETLSLLIEKINDKEIQQVAESTGKTLPKDLLLAMKGEYNIQEWLSVLRSRAIAAGFQYSEMPENGTMKIITQHNMGLKWSNYFKSYYETSFKQFGCNPKFTVTENTIAMEIEKKFF